ncbi:MAG TPA: alpha/beta fold hydrolase [Streptosporangiaceae bacterium]|jgi:pimeloyl-ACP methyl ester carboxylesterase|nr:alpha/beta fold hydrolase [Streptosporangiaceae bacterium]
MPQSAQPESARLPGVVLSSHHFEVPLDHAAPDGEQITVFAREVVALEQASRDDLPWLLYLQGGPGRQSPRPVSRNAGWLNRAVREFRVLLLDQRGTGRSTPANRLTLAARGSATQQAAYLTHFRADSIVADAELIRHRLAGGRPWSVLGQSFGGFAAVSYLSKAPEGIAEAFITGGLPGLDTTADDVYRATYPQVIAKNEAHYARFPGDVELAQRIAAHLAARDVKLPTGAPLTVRSFQALGLGLGMSTGSNALHYLLEDAFDGDELGDDFLYRALSQLSFANGPLFGALHEACYGQGPATRWAAERVRAGFGAFDVPPAPGGDPVLFTGEMIYPWMFQADPVLRPLAEVADILADHADWPPLYDPARLAANDVPVAAAIYYNDMYVPQQFSVRTAAAIKGLRSWVTSEHEHDGLSASKDAVLDRLIGLARGTI